MKNNSLNTIGNEIIVLKPSPIELAGSLIEVFNVTTVSVVATAEIKVKTGTKNFQLDWGDGHVSRISTTGPIIHSGPSISPRSEDRTYTLQHVYEISDDQEFQMWILLSTYGQGNISDIRILNLTIRPKYRIWFSDIFFRLIEKGDSLFESESEWVITQQTHVQHTSEPYQETIGGPFRWGELNIVEQVLPTPYIRLEGSRKSYDLFRNERLLSSIQFLEIDPVTDDPYWLYISLDPKSSQETVEKTTGPIQYRYDISISLLKPLIDNSPLRTL